MSDGNWQPCWRGECRTACAYANVCTEGRYASAPAPDQTDRGGLEEALAGAVCATVAQLIDAAVAQRTAHLVIEGERLREVVGRVADLRAAAEHLLWLKDGPRDSAYYEAKDRAWDYLRAALHPEEAR